VVKTRNTAPRVVFWQIGIGDSLGCVLQHEQTLLFVKAENEAG
jgi:hypothetical protein